MPNLPTHPITSATSQNTTLPMIGHAVRVRRTESGLRIDDAAALCGVSVGLLSRLENGKPVGLDKLLKVLDGLGLSLLLVTKEDLRRMTEVMVSVQER